MDRRARSPRFHGGRNASRCRYAQGPVVGACGRARQARAVSVGNDAFRPLDLAGLNNGLTANPVEFLTRSSGTWTLVCLLVTLSITPLRRLTGQPALVRLRRMCGLFAFFYGFLHFMAWVWWDRDSTLRRCWPISGSGPSSPWALSPLC